MAESLDTRLETPETSLEALSFAETSLPALGQWASGLPLVNTEETAAQLTLATAELALLSASPDDKFALLETLRPMIHYIATRLDRSSLNAAKAHKDSAAQNLMLNLCTGYKCVALDIIDADDKSSNKDILPSTLHRLLSDLSRVLLRTLQFYSAPPRDFWWEFNELYRICTQLELNGFRLKDEENHTSELLSIEDVYLRALLLSCAKPNQLKHQEISSVFNALEHWTGPVSLEEDTADSLFMIDLAGNAGPQFTKLVDKAEMPMGLHTEVLAYEIEAYLNDVDSAFTIPPALSQPLLRHLVEAWSVMQERTFARFRTDVSVRVCVGLRAAHYFLSGAIDFTKQLSSADAMLRREINPFLELDYESSHSEEDDDPWSQAHDLKVRIPLNPNVEAPEKILLDTQNDQHVASYENFETQALDTSPGGYRLAWRDQLPPNAVVGELLALREEKGARWCVAVIRWIRQDRGRTSMGLELLSPRAIPVAVRVIQKKGGPTDYARGLILPQIESIGQDATLITPRMPFASGQKVHINRQGLQTTGQLLDARLKTESLNQFTFRMLDGYLENSRSDSNIDSLSAMTREDTTQGP